MRVISHFIWKKETKLISLWGSSDYKKPSYNTLKFFCIVTCLKRSSLASQTVAFWRAYTSNFDSSASIEPNLRGSCQNLTCKLFKAQQFTHQILTALPQLRPIWRRAVKIWRVSPSKHNSLTRQTWAFHRGKKFVVHGSSKMVVCKTKRKTCPVLVKNNNFKIIIVIIYSNWFSTLLKSLVQWQKQLHTQQTDNSDTF